VIIPPADTSYGARTIPAARHAAAPSIGQHRRPHLPGAPSQTTGKPNAHEVQRGDTLWGLVEDHLRAQGRANPTPEAIQRGVQRVAEANGISDPNLIFVGQRVDLSALGKSSPSITSRAQTKAEPSLEVSLAGLLGGDGRLSSGFGPRNDPINGRRAEHRGVDIAARRGTSVHPLMAGAVTFSGWQRGYGNVVILRHADGIETVYAHNRENLVRQGDTVDESTVLARVGSTGRATGPHLHFEVREHGRQVDPMAYMTGSRLDLQTGP